MQCPFIDHPFVVIWGVSQFLSMEDLVDADDLFHFVNVAGPLLGLHLVEKKAEVMVASWELQYVRLLHNHLSNHNCLSSSLD